ncbi:MAG: hypothetical protein ABI036_13895 [Fibrobacteria bacterium]
MNSSQRSFGFGTLALMLIAAMGLPGLHGCGVGSEVDREPSIVTGIRLDSVIFVPAGSRFILKDSTTELLIRRFFPGYACSQVLEMDLDSAASGNPPAYSPLTRVQLPAAANCALDSAEGRDTSITHVFRAGELIRLANSAGSITDSAALVQGEFEYDSLAGVFSSVTHVFSSGHYSVVDSGAGTGRYLYIDTLACGQYLNHAEARESGDTLKVRLSLVTLDPGSAPDSCRGSTHEDTVAISAARPRASAYRSSP